MIPPRNIVTACAVALLAMCFLALPVRASDIKIFPTGPVFSVNNLTWGASGPGKFNNNFWFVPVNTNESVCAYVYNNNTTNSHTFNATITVNSKPQNTTPSDGSWQASAQSTGILSVSSPGIPGGIGASIAGSALVSINLSGSTSLGGSPETASLIVLQTPGNCSAGQNFIGSSPQAVSSTPAIDAISDGLSQAFFIQLQTINPAGGDVLHVNVNNASKTLHFNTAIFINTSAAPVLLGIVSTSTLGSTCTPNTSGIFNLKSGSTVASAATANSQCAGHPTAFGTQNIIVPVNETVVIDLTGRIAQAATTTGIDITSTAITGTLFTSLYWYEK